MAYQITAIKLEGYGSWTLSLGSDREYQLQILQSNIYSDLQYLFSNKNGIVFSNRFDELIAVTNKITVEEHKEISAEVTRKYQKIRFSMSIGIGLNPLEANKNSYYVKNNANCLTEYNIYMENHDMKHSLDSKSVDLKDQSDECVKILHIDINNSTAITKNLSPYEITNLIIKLHSYISDIFLKEDGLTFYLGGDNFMIVVKKNMTKERVKQLVDQLTQITKIHLNCGIGVGKTGRKAAEMATKSLDSIRDFRKKGIILNVFEVS